MEMDTPKEKVQAGKTIDALKRKCAYWQDNGCPEKRMGVRSWIHGNEDGFTEMEMDALK